MVFSVKSNAGAIIQEDYWSEIRITILEEFLELSDFKGIETFDQIDKELSGTGYLLNLFNQTLVNELSQLCTEILVKSRKDSEGSKTNILLKLDKDNNGIIDIIEDKNEFNQLLKKTRTFIVN